MSNFIRAFWCLSTNFGDALNPWFIERLSGKHCVYDGLDTPTTKHVAIGSILNWCDHKCVVWGAGVAGKDRVRRDLDIRAVRGPISANAARQPDVVKGDPAILLPGFYRPERTTRYKLGIIPHYAEQDLWLQRGVDQWGWCKYINVLDPIERVIDEICSCDRIISSSLHGLIAADAYGVPARWVSIPEAEGRINGDGRKYVDYQLSVGADVPCWVLDKKDDPTDFPKRPNPQVIPLVEPLLESCPFYNGDPLPYAFD